MNGVKSKHPSRFHKNLRKSNFKLLCDRAAHFPVPDCLPEVRVIMCTVTVLCVVEKCSVPKLVGSNSQL